jgi:hypothetical protein
MLFFATFRRDTCRSPYGCVLGSQDLAVSRLIATQRSSVDARKLLKKLAFQSRFSARTRCGSLEFSPGTRSHPKHPVCFQIYRVMGRNLACV